RKPRKVLVRLKRVDTDLARIANLNRAIARAPHDPALRCEAGRILLRNGLEAEGLRWLESALAENPRDAPTHQAPADHYERIGSAERAAQHRQRALGRGTPLAGSEKARP